MDSFGESLIDVIRKKRKEPSDTDGEKPPCSSKDKDQPQRDEVSKGTDQGTSKDEEKTKGDAKKDEAAVFSADQDTSTDEGKTKEDEKKDEAAVFSADQDTSTDEGKTKEDEKEDEAAGPLKQTLQNLQQMQLYAGTENINTTLTEKLKTIASDKGFRISDNQGSGNCMFHALSEQLETVKGIKIQHGQLRQSLVQYLRKNSRLPDGTDLCHFVYGHETWANYLTYMEQDGAWGDHVILCAAANCFKTCIHVVSSLNNDVVIRPHGLVDESKPLVLGHIHEVHYVSLQPIKEIAPDTSIKSKTKDKNEQTKSDQGGTSVSENNKQLTQSRSAEGGSDVTKMKFTPLLDCTKVTDRTLLMNAAVNINIQEVKSLIKRGVDPSKTNSSGWNSLHFAAQGGDTDIIDLIHTHLPNIESKTGQGVTPLMVAASNGKLLAVKWFLEKGATVTCKDNRGANMFHYAAEGGDTRIISLIHAYLPNIDSETIVGSTPLMVAASCGKLHAVQWFLKKGASVTCEEIKGWNALHYAAQGGDTDIISLIHTRFHNIESKTSQGCTPLMVAASSGKLHAVQWFLEKRASVNCENNRGWNSLHFAAQGGDTDIIDLIHTHFPNIESKTGQGCTPLMVAASNCKLPAVKWFLEKGANVNCEDNREWNTLHHAAQGGDTDIIDLIHTHLPNIESKTDVGSTPLMVAAISGKLDGVKWFLEKGATVNFEDDRGWNTLHFAAQGGDAGIISLIYPHLPDIESKTADGQTPLIIAVAFGKRPAVKYLLEKGANPLAEDNKGLNSLFYASLCGSDLMDLLLDD